MEVKKDTKRRVIAYSRFSTKRQEHGDSLERQHAAALRWCTQKGLELDTELTFSDHGRSGFKGHNSKKGALRVLVDMCKEGQIQTGSYILFEAFDRMTRMPIIEAQNLFTELLSTGVVVVTLNNGKEWRHKNLRNISDFLFSVLDLFRGNQESERKSAMLRSAFRAARESGDKWKFASLPGWIGKEGGKKDGAFVVKEELAESVVKVFDLAALGFTSKDIAIRANAENWPIPARLQQTEAWTANMPRRLLLNRAVLGEHEHKQYYNEIEDDEGDVEVEYLSRGKSTGIVVKDYYPRIISDELWAASRVGIKVRGAAPKRDYNKLNFWSGMIFCGTCGAAMHRRQDIKKSGDSIKGTMYCSAKKDGRSNCKPMAMRKFDTTVLSAITTFAASELGNHVGQSSLNEEAEALATLLADAVLRRANVMQAIEKMGFSDAFHERYEALEKEVKELEAKLTATREEAAFAASGSMLDTSFLESVLPHIYSLDSESADIRAALFLKLNRLVDSIIVFPYDLAVVYFRGESHRLTVPLPHKSHVPKPQHKQAELFSTGSVEHAAIKRPVYQSSRFR
ncbi:recombinase family protein [Malikia spinosa]|uniref:Recombinase family protein n=1 Tax=Malikia spinosa TaxID=86180 RepID=A0A7C9N465_9BURK|nr:recombinase family protein [Malikia spinosa]MYZ53660.1 recombinase family protein [Malikia spinosa]